MRRDHRQLRARAASCDGGAHMRLVARQAGALHLDVVATAETMRGQALARASPRALASPGSSAWPTAPRVGARQRDQAVGPLGEPCAT